MVNVRSYTRREAKLNDKELIIIGMNHGLENYKLLSFVNFFKKAFPEESSYSYAGEWSMRFRDNSVYAHADSESKKILKEMKYVEIDSYL